ncbi:hypothetical protein LINGRAPRIM_LOCUS1304 [Linum grandiflorum]
MASKAQLRTVLKKKMKKPTRGSWLQRAVNYLKSDSYLFAPLLNPLPPPPTKTGCSPAKKIRFSGLGKRITKGLIGKNAMEYLKSDSYLYGPLLVNQRPNDCSFEKGMNKEDKRKSSVLEPSNVTAEKEVFGEEEAGGDDVVLPITPERNHINGGHQRQKVRRKEMVTVTHMVRRSSRSSPLSSAVSGEL